MILKKKRLVMVIIEPPGAGKDTQAGFISKKYKLKILYTGDMLRREVERKTKIGRKIQRDLEAGNLVDNSVVNQMLMKEVKKYNGNILIDGFPRNLEQARGFHLINYVLYLSCTKKEITKRLLKRAKTEERKDDDGGIINHRWGVYEKKSKPVIGFYRRKGNLRQVDGNKSITEVRERILDF